MESDTVYAVDEFLMAARTLPVVPRHDEGWAIATAGACARAAATNRGALEDERVDVEIGLSDQQDRIVWYVFIPEREPDDRHSIPRPGAAFLIDEADGSCQALVRE